MNCLFKLLFGGDKGMLVIILLVFDLFIFLAAGICFLNKSKMFMYLLFFNNIVSILTLLLYIADINVLLEKNDIVALLDTTFTMSQVFYIYFLGKLLIQCVLLLLYHKRY